MEQIELDWVDSDVTVKYSFERVEGEQDVGIPDHFKVTIHEVTAYVHCQFITGFQVPVPEYDELAIIEFIEKELEIN